MSELPKDWRMGTLRDLAKVRNGYAFKSSDFIDEGVPLIRQSNLVGDTVEIDNAKCLPPSFLDEHPRFTVKKGDVLIGMSGSIGKLSWYRHDTPALQNQRTGLLEFEVPGSAGWVCYFLNSVERQLNQTAKGVAVQNISGKEIEALSLPIPPLPEQRRIVARIEELFSRLDAGVAALLHAKAQLQRYRQSVLAAAVTGQLTQAWREQHSDTEPAEELLERIFKQRREEWDRRGKYKEPDPLEEIPVESIPESWAWASIAQIGFVQLGRQRSPKNRSKDYPTKYIRAANITEDGLALTDILEMEFSPGEQSRFRLEFGDLILSEASGSPDQVGKPAIWKDQIENCCFQNTVIRLRAIGFDNEFLLILLKHFHRNKVFAKIAGGVGINHLSAAKFSKMAAAVPPLAEQHQIVAEVEARTIAIEHLEAELDCQITRSYRLRQSSLSSAFTGEF
jgi:type I restriction enzyme, S subunit